MQNHNVFLVISVCGSSFYLAPEQNSPGQYTHPWMHCASHVFTHVLYIEWSPLSLCVSPWQCHNYIPSSRMSVISVSLEAQGLPYSIY